MTCDYSSVQQGNAWELDSCNSLHKEQERTSVFRSINAPSYKLGIGGFSMGEPGELVWFGYLHNVMPLPFRSCSSLQTGWQHLLRDAAGVQQHAEPALLVQSCLGAIKSLGPGWH